MGLAMTTKEIRLAAKLIRQSEPIGSVLAQLQFRHTAEAIKSAVEKYRIKRRQVYANTYSARKNNVEYATICVAPPAVIEQRDQRQRLHPKTLTARICGDPLPGFSALDMRAKQKCAAE